MMLRLAVALIALIEAFSGWMDLVIVGDILNKPDLSSGGLIALAPMVLHLLLAVAALGFAVARRPRFGVAALALWALVRWARNISIFGWIAISPATDAAGVGLALFTNFGQPLLCATALAAAWCNRHLAAATAAVAAMTVFDLAAITIFAIGVSLFGA